MMDKMKKDKMYCTLVGSVTVDQQNGEGLLITMDKLEEDKCEGEGTGEHRIICLMKNGESCVEDTCVNEWMKGLKNMYQTCKSNNPVNLNRFVHLRLHCSVVGARCTCYLEMVTVATELKATPIPPLPVLSTPLSKILAGKENLSDVQNEPKTGFITMEQTRRLVLMLENDPKVLTLPLIGIWVSGVSGICHPYVWAASLRYLNCSSYQDRVCLPPQPFLIMLYASVNHSSPLFYDCVTTSGSNKFIPCMFKGSLETSVAKVPVFNNKMLEIYLEKVPSDSESCNFQEAYQNFMGQIITDTFISTSKKPILLTPSNDEMPRNTPNPHILNPLRTFPAVPDVSLISDGNSEEGTCTDDGYVLPFVMTSSSVNHQSKIHYSSPKLSQDINTIKIHKAPQCTVEVMSNSQNQAIPKRPFETVHRYMKERSKQLLTARSPITDTPQISPISYSLCTATSMALDPTQAFLDNTTSKQPKGPDLHKNITINSQVCHSPGSMGFCENFQKSALSLESSLQVSTSAIPHNSYNEYLQTLSSSRGNHLPTQVRTENSVLPQNTQLSEKNSVKFHLNNFPFQGSPQNVDHCLCQSCYPSNTRQFGKKGSQQTQKLNEKQKSKQKTLFNQHVNTESTPSHVSRNKCSSVDKVCCSGVYAEKVSDSSIMDSSGEVFTHDPYFYKDVPPQVYQLLQKQDEQLRQLQAQIQRLLLAQEAKTTISEAPDVTSQKHVTTKHSLSATQNLPLLPQLCSTSTMTSLMLPDTPKQIDVGLQTEEELPSCDSVDTGLGDSCNSPVTERLITPNKTNTPAVEVKNFNTQTTNKTLCLNETVKQKKQVLESCRCKNRTDEHLSTMSQQQKHINEDGCQPFTGCYHKCCEGETDESFTVTGIEVCTVYDPQPSPAPSIHVDVQDYVASIHSPTVVNNQGSENQSFESPVLGESASFVEQNLQGNIHRILAKQAENESKLEERRMSCPDSSNSLEHSFLKHEVLHGISHSSERRRSLEDLRDHQLEVRAFNEYDKRQKTDKDWSTPNSFCLPKLNYQTLFLSESDPDLSVEVNSLALKYLEKEQLSQLAKEIEHSKIHKQKKTNNYTLLRKVLKTKVQEPGPTDITLYGMPMNNLSFATKAYLERNGLAQKLPSCSDTISKEACDHNYGENKAITSSSEETLWVLKNMEKRSPQQTQHGKMLFTNKEKNREFTRVLDITALRQQPKLL
ncbi:SCL-interrupting locus protein homolog isoform X2 [Tachypleus tridentatus]|uniref:SCL-interrupting locus protein homolog isoform X2 n=1 Tax=Tachypleus tridentatus TaxID=6853 RepID=UPI003FD419E5